MKTIIAGGRNYLMTVEDWKFLSTLDITEVVSGGAQGADKGGEIWAINAKIPIKKFPADWKRLGRAAGPIRNKEMAEYSEQAVLFEGGAGTKSMTKLAQYGGLLVHIR
tara:strand:- start:82 stop:405 length:324 start_codon:yes stop_codon:yes gene_type:complete